MGADIKPLGRLIRKTTYKTARLIEDQIRIAKKEHDKMAPVRRRIISRKAGKKTAQRWGLNPVKDIDAVIKQELTEKIISEVKNKKLTHQQVGIIVRTSRPSITRVLNRNLKEVSIEFLLRILSSLGIQVGLTFR